MLLTNLLRTLLCLALLVCFLGCGSTPLEIVESDQAIEDDALYKKPFPTPGPCPDPTKPPKGQKCR